jgi:hypothetical protein
VLATMAKKNERGVPPVGIATNTITLLFFLVFNLLKILKIYRKF